MINLSVELDELMTATPPEIVAVPCNVQPVLPAAKSPFVTNSAPSTNPFDLSNRKPTTVPGVVTGVVPARSENMVDRSLGSSQMPCAPPEKSDSGVKLPPKTCVLPKYADVIDVVPRYSAVTVVVPSEIGMAYPAMM